MRTHAILVAALLAGAAFGGEGPRPLQIGAVAGGPEAVKVWRGIKAYFAANRFPIDYVLYSNYDALVDALATGHVDIAWNTPLAHARYHVRSGGKSQTL